MPASSPLRLMAVLAHPDDESLGLGGTFARYAAEGVETYLVTATRGERGWPNPASEYPGPDALGRIREGELRAAAAVLGLREVNFLDFVDGELDQANPSGAIVGIVRHLRRVRPQVVLTFGPEGGYGHPDHIAISQFTTAALVCAADPDFAPAAGQQPHRVSKFYYRIWTGDEVALYEQHFGYLSMHVDGVERSSMGWAEWAITTRLDTAAYWPSVWRAVSCHRSQLPSIAQLEMLTEDQHRRLWCQQGYYRVYSTVNSGRAENDLFEGLR